MKTTLRFDQLSCRLQVEGLPDVSVGQSGEVVGIITGWTLEWAGRPELEGRKHHLLALMGVVLPYARHLLSGVARPFGGHEAPVTIEPLLANAGRQRTGHQLPAEADPEYADAGGRGGTHHLHLFGNPGESLVVHRPPGTQRHDHVVSGWVREGDIADRIISALMRHDLERADIEA